MIETVPCVREFLAWRTSRVTVLAVPARSEYRQRALRLIEAIRKTAVGFGSREFTLIVVVCT